MMLSNPSQERDNELARKNKETLYRRGKVIYMLRTNYFLNVCIA
jgi:hypothetical protein